MAMRVYWKLYHHLGGRLFVFDLSDPPKYQVRTFAPSAGKIPTADVAGNVQKSDQK